MSRVLIFLSAILAIAPMLVLADEPLEIDLRGTGLLPGAKLRVRSRSETKEMETTISQNGRVVLSSKLESVGLKEVELTIEEVKDRAITKYRTKITKDETSESVKPGDAKIRRGSLVDQVVVSQKIDSGWSHALASGKPSKEQENELAGMMPIHHDEQLIPAGKQKIGATWEVDVAKTPTIAAAGLLTPTGKLKGTFVGIEERDGRLCTLIEWKGTIKGKIKVGEELVAATMQVDYKEYRLLKQGIEIRGEGLMNLKVTGTINLGDSTAEIRIQGSLKDEKNVELME